MSTSIIILRHPKHDLLNKDSDISKEKEVEVHKKTEKVETPLKLKAPKTKHGVRERSVRNVPNEQSGRSQISGTEIPKLEDSEFNFFSPLTELEPLEFDLKYKKLGVEKVDLLQPPEFDWSERPEIKWKFQGDMDGNDSDLE